MRESSREVFDDGSTVSVRKKKKKNCLVNFTLIDDAEENGGFLASSFSLP